MRQFVVSAGLFVYFALYLVDAQSLRDRINKANTIDDFSEDNRYSSRQATEQKFTERDDSDDLVATDRKAPFPKEKSGSDEIDNEFKSDLTAIRRFAQNVRPMATNMRRSMNSRRAMRQEVGVLMNYVKDTLLSVIDSADKYIPHLMPLTKILRRFVLGIFGR